MAHQLCSALLALVAFLTTATQAHMILQNPVPYGVDTINNSPLENSFPGDYPCKQRSGVYDMPSSGYNKFAVGSKITASFKGSATHGGGSCQFAVTTDQRPTVSSTFKVIYSVVGGCPEGPVSFTVPPELPNGKYTLAWTWFNKIGNREMYMNCAPIEVTGGADTVDALMKLPDMYTLNIPNTECASEDSKDFVFPQPGKYKTTAASVALATAGPSGSGCAKAIKIGAGAGKVTMPAGGSSGSGSGDAANAEAPVAPAPTQAPAYAASSSGFVTSVRPVTSASDQAPASANPNLPSAYSLPTAFGPSASASAPYSSAAGAASSGSVSSSSASSDSLGSSSVSSVTSVSSTPTTTRFSTLTLSALPSSSAAAQTSATQSSSSPTSSDPNTKLTVSTAAPSAGTALPPAIAPSAAPYPIVGSSSTLSSAAGVAAPTNYSNPYGSSGGGSSSGSGNGSGTATSNTGTSIDTCASDGSLLCSGPSKFGLCNHGRVVWQDVAAGTRCVGGQIV